MAKKKLVDFKHRTAKVGKKLAPVNETRIEVKFGSLDVIRTSLTSAAAVAASQGDTSSAAHLTLQAALQHCRHHSQGQRQEALGTLRSMHASNPGLIHNNLVEVLSSLGGVLVDMEAPLRAHSAQLLAEIYGGLPPRAAAPHLPVVLSHLCAALARPHAGIRLDAVGAVALLLGGGTSSAAILPTSSALLNSAILPHLVGLLEPQLHATGAVPSLAAGVPPSCYCLGEAVAPGKGEKDIGVERRKAGGRDSRLAVVYALRRVLLGGRDGGCGDVGGSSSPLLWDMGSSGESSSSSSSSGSGSGMRPPEGGMEVERSSGGGSLPIPTAIAERRGGGHQQQESPSSPTTATLPLPIAVEAIGHLCGLWLEFVGGGGDATLTTPNFYALSLLAHTLLLCIKGGGVVEGALGCSSVAREGGKQAVEAFTALVGGGKGGGGSGTVEDSQVLRSLLSEVHRFRGGGGGEREGGSKGASLPLPPPTPHALAQLALRAINANVMRTFPMPSPTAMSGGVGGGRKSGGGSDGVSGMAPLFFSLALLNSHLAMLALEFLPPPSYLTQLGIELVGGKVAPALLRSYKSLSSRVTALVEYAQSEIATVTRVSEEEGEGGGGGSKKGSEDSHRGAASIAVLSYTLHCMSRLLEAVGGGGQEHRSSGSGGGGGGDGEEMSGSASHQPPHILAPLLMGVAPLITSLPCGTPHHALTCAFLCKAVESKAAHSIPGLVPSWLSVIPKTLWMLGGGDAGTSMALLRVLWMVEGVRGGSQDLARQLTPLLYTVSSSGECLFGPFIEYPPPLAAALVSVVSSTTAPFTHPLLRACAVIARCPNAPIQSRSALTQAIVERALRGEAVYASEAAVGGPLGGAACVAAPASGGSGSAATLRMAAARGGLDPAAKTATAFLLSIALGKMLQPSSLMQGPAIVPCSGLPSAPGALAERGCVTAAAAAAAVPPPPASLEQGVGGLFSVLGLSEGDAVAYDTAVALTCQGLQRVGGRAVGGPRELSKAVRQALEGLVFKDTAREGSVERCTVFLHRVLRGEVKSWEASMLCNLAVCLEDGEGGWGGMDGSASSGNTPPGAGLGGMLVACLAALIIQGGLEGWGGGDGMGGPKQLKQQQHQHQHQQHHQHQHLTPLGPTASCVAPFRAFPTPTNTTAAKHWLLSPLLSLHIPWLLHTLSGVAVGGEEMGGASGTAAATVLLALFRAPSPWWDGRDTTGLRSVVEETSRALKGAAQPTPPLVHAALQACTGTLGWLG